MRSLLKSSFTWQFAGGFALGAVALVTLQPAHAAPHPHHPVAAVASVATADR